MVSGGNGRLQQLNNHLPGYSPSAVLLIRRSWGLRGNFRLRLFSSRQRITELGITHDRSIRSSKDRMAHLWIQRGDSKL